MRNQTRRLGRGIDALISAAKTTFNPQEVSSDRGGQSAIVVDIPLEKIATNPYQPRSSAADADITALAESIAASGVLQPIIVRVMGDSYQIIAGERRFHAVSRLKWPTIPAIIKVAGEQQMLEWALIENIQREDLNAIDRAEAYRNYCDRFGLSAETLADRLGEDRSTVLNYIRLLDLPHSIRQLVALRQISMGHARCLLGLETDKEREMVAQRILLDQLSVRATEALVRDFKAHHADQNRNLTSPTKGRRTRPHLSDMEKRFETVLAMKIQIIESATKGRGKVVIHFSSYDDFDRLCDKLGVIVD